MNDESISALKKDILLYNWTYINDSSLNLNEVVYKFINSLNILYNTNCTLSIKNHKINPWMTDSLLKCVSKKNYISNLLEIIPRKIYFNKCFKIYSKRILS